MIPPRRVGPDYLRLFVESARGVLAGYGSGPGGTWIPGPLLALHSHRNQSTSSLILLQEGCLKKRAQARRRRRIAEKATTGSLPSR